MSRSLSSGDVARRKILHQDVDNDSRPARTAPRKSDTDEKEDVPSSRSAEASIHGWLLSGDPKVGHRSARTRAALRAEELDIAAGATASNDQGPYGQSARRRIAASGRS
jgi:hypothetical protein